MKFFVFVLMFFSVFSVYSQRIRIDEAEKFAINFYSLKTGKTENPTIKDSLTIEHEGQAQIVLLVSRMLGLLPYHFGRV